MYPTCPAQTCPHCNSLPLKSGDKYKQYVPVVQVKPAHIPTGFPTKPKQRPHKATNFIYLFCTQQNKYVCSYNLST
jgi:hypothetical protein